MCNVQTVDGVLDFISRRNDDVPENLGKELGIEFLIGQFFVKSLTSGNRWHSFHS